VFALHPIEPLGKTRFQARFDTEAKGNWEMAY